MTPPVEMIVPQDADPGVRLCSEAWAACLRDSGFQVASADVDDSSDDATAVIVSPHAVLRSVEHDPQRVTGLLRRSVCVSTSRLASGALGADRPFQDRASASLALSRDASRYLTGHGVATEHFKLGSHECLRARRPEQRSIAVGAHARYSEYREDLLARSRVVMDAYSCDLRVSHSAVPRPASHLEPGDWLVWLTSVDIVVTLPPEAGPGIDWCEVAPAVLNGALVLTTSESDFAPLEPGEDIAVATNASFSDSLRRLLDDDERRRQMRESALAKLLAEPLDVSPLAEAIVAVGSRRRRVRSIIQLPPRTPVSRAVAECRMPEALRAAKSARSRRASARTGRADRISTTTAWHTCPPADISVVIPSYNQAEFVGDAVESALAAVGVEVEIIVVDDRSTDESVQIVRAVMEANDHRALKLVERSDNAGLSGARNHGFREARTAFMLLLDADDALLPHGPMCLHSALEADSEAAFAYGFLARVGLEREDLLGTEPWDPELFRYGNYVPVTCSLVRRSTWDLVDGYTAEGLLELGWEDLDFWLRIARARIHAAHVRRIVGSYRLHGESMSTLTNRHAGALMQFLRERYPDLMDLDDS